VGNLEIDEVFGRSSAAEFRKGLLAAASGPSAVCREPAEGKATALNLCHG
jgi:hypothetical protein